MADGNIGVASISGLDDSFDRVIRGLPERFLTDRGSILLPEPDAPDRNEQLYDPYTVLGRVRDNVASVVLRDSEGMYAGLNVRNIFLHDLSKPHAIVLSHAAVSEVGGD